MSHKGVADNAWDRGVAALARIRPDIRDVARLDQAALAAIASAAIVRLRGDDRYFALELLKLVDRPPVAALVDELVSIATFDKHAAQVRVLLGQLSHADLERLLPPAIRAQLNESEFGDVLNYGALLKHFGLSEALLDLLRVASASPDPEIRSIGPEWFPDEHVTFQNAD